MKLFAYQTIKTASTMKVYIKQKPFQMQKVQRNRLQEASNINHM